MNKIKIVTDSTIDIPNETINKYGIEVVPLTLHINGETFTDRVDITPTEFIKKMRQSPELPKSSQPSAGTFLEVYDRFGEQGYEVISIHMTGGMSGTVQSANTAAEMTKTKVTVVDSRFISKALSFQVIEAAEMVLAGKTTAEIVARLDKVREQTRLYVVVDTLENLVKGGRIGKGRAMIGSLLNIKPIASLEGGVYTPVAKVRSHSQVVKWLSKQIADEVKGKTIKGVGVVHAESFEVASRIKDAVTELTGYTNIEIDDTTPVISTHAGIGAIGFFYYFE